MDEPNSPLSKQPVTDQDMKNSPSGFVAGVIVVATVLTAATILFIA